jgi:hypothetical protein
MHAQVEEVLAMLLSILLSVVMSMFAGTAVDKNASPKPTPLMRTVEPTPVKVSEVVTIKGDHLDKDFISAVYVSDGKKDIQVTVQTQTSDTVSFKVPAELKPGSYRVIVLLNIAEPTLVEEPVRLNIID